MAVRKFPNEGVIGAEYATLVVETGGLSNAVLFTPILGKIGVDAVREDIANMQPGDELPNLVLEAASVKALIELLQSSQVTREAEPVEVMTPLVDGKESGVKQYRLWLTHDEIHLLYWALKTAEAFNDDSDGSTTISNGMTYVTLRGDVIDDSAFNAFIDKFDNMHRQARIDDGEESGVKSTDESTMEDA